MGQSILHRLGIMWNGETALYLVRPQQSPSDSVEVERMPSVPTGSEEISQFLDRHIGYKGWAIRDEETWETWRKEHKSSARILLITKRTKVPLMYKVLSSQFPQVAFAAMRQSAGTAFLSDLYEAPALLWIEPGKESGEILYRGQLTRRSIAAFITNEMPYYGRFVYDEATLKRFLITSSTRPKLLLLSSRGDGIPFGFKLLSLELRGKIDFAIAQRGVAGSDFVAGHYRSTGVHPPAAMFFDDGDARPSVLRGALTRTALREQLLQQLQELQKGRAEQSTGSDDSSGEPLLRGCGPDPPEQFSAQSAGRLCPRTVHCNGQQCQEQLCLMLVTVPSFIDTRAAVVMELYGKALKALQRGFETGRRTITAPVVASWVDAVQQNSFLQAIGAEMGHLPKVVALRPRSQRFATFHDLGQDEAMVLDSLASWVCNVSAGQGDWQDLHSPLADSLY